MPAELTLQELLLNIEKARQRMGTKNPHKLLFRQCEDALIQLAVRVGELEQETAHAPTPENAVGHIIIP